MALRAGAFPEKLGHSACSQPACAGKDWCITHPIGQRCTDDQPTIKGRTSANFGYSKPLFACVHRTFGDQFIASPGRGYRWPQHCGAGSHGSIEKGIAGDEKCVGPLAHKDWPITKMIGVVVAGSGFGPSPTRSERAWLPDSIDRAAT